jgi:hypothetical protein
MPESHVHLSAEVDTEGTFHKSPTERGDRQTYGDEREASGKGHAYSGLPAKRNPELVLRHDAKSGYSHAMGGDAGQTVFTPAHRNFYL